MSDERPGQRTEEYRVRLYEDRWAVAGQRTGIVSLDQKPSWSSLRGLDLFKDIEPEILDDITQDVSIAAWEPGAVLFEEGSYIDVAFYVLEGEVMIHSSVTQRPGRLGLPVFDPAATQAGTQPASPMSGPGTSAETVQESMIRSQLKATQGSSPGVAPFLATLEVGIPGDRALRLGPGDLFGEIGALNGWPQSVTARTSTACQLVQIRVPALQKLREESAAFKQWVDRVYRERTLLFHLRALPLLAGCDDRMIQSIADEVELISVRPGAAVAQEGKPAEAMFLVRSGCLKLSQKVGEGEIAVSYLAKGMVLGDVEFVLRQNATWTGTASSVGYSELVKMGPSVVARLRARAEIEKQLWDGAVQRVKEAGYARQHAEYGELLDFSLQKGLVQGTSILVIDLDRCTRCDDCVRACAETHGGQPRFVRDGTRYQHHLIARACYHCRDPVCLIGCPTGAIHRAQVGDVVEIQESICIGCRSCANKCPYDAIIMQPTGKAWPDDAVPEHNRGKPRLVASKCDLCHTSTTGPACVNNCPQGCAIRVGTMEDLKTMLRPDSERTS